MDETYGKKLNVIREWLFRYTDPKPEFDGMMVDAMAKHLLLEIAAVDHIGEINEMVMGTISVNPTKWSPYKIL